MNRSWICAAGSSFVFVRLINERTRTRFFVRLNKRTNMNKVLVRSIMFVNVRLCSFVYVRERFVRLCSWTVHSFMFVRSRILVFISFIIIIIYIYIYLIINETQYTLTLTLITQYLYQQPLFSLRLHLSSFNHLSKLLSLKVSTCYYLLRLLSLKGQSYYLLSASPLS